MNNNYDGAHAREKPTKEMRAKGWEMTGDGFWIKEEEPPVTNYYCSRVERTLSSLVLPNLFLLTRLFFSDPKLGQSKPNCFRSETTIGYSDYQPLSKAKAFRIKTSYIVACEPLEELARSYEQQVGVSTHG